jgi:hypothetical protein
MKLLEIWRRLFTTKYSGILEAEVARLRAENRDAFKFHPGDCGSATDHN